MYLSATALLIALNLVAAAPRPQAPTGQSVIAHIHGSENLENSNNKAIVQVDISITPQSGSEYSTPSLDTKTEKIPGWVFFEQNRIQGRIHGNTFWNIKGELSEKLPFDELLVDPVIYSLNHPKDFEGEFTGSAGRGEITLKWKSGATITGRSNAGEITITGKTYVDWSP